MIFIRVSYIFIIHGAQIHTRENRRIRQQSIKLRKTKEFLSFIRMRTACSANCKHNQTKTMWKLFICRNNYYLSLNWTIFIIVCLSFANIQFWMRYVSTGRTTGIWSVMNYTRYFILFIICRCFVFRKKVKIDVVRCLFIDKQNHRRR